jgi:diguanylate cyclase (GGDEF)-like protein
MSGVQVQTNKPNRSIRRKIAAAFIAVACFVAVFVGVTIAIHNATVESAAQLEAGHVAELIADAAMENNNFRPHLQEYVSHLTLLRNRDVVIVDAGKMGVADVNPDEIGKVFDHDPDNEVGKTIIDGQARTFIEKNDLHPEGAHQIVVSLWQDQSNLSKEPVGAVILEYTPIRDDLFAEESGEMYLIVATGTGIVLIVTLFGFGLAKRISQPLLNLKSSAERIASQDYKARVVVTSQDEIGLLGLAFNKMAEDLSVSHDELVEQKRELEKRVAERTQELKQSNILLQHELHEHRIAAERAEYLAYYDTLTDLPNRSMFSKLLNEHISQARRFKRQLAVLFLDLDHFKHINDSLGHDAGDELLQGVAKRLKTCLRDSDTVARLGGDEFVVVLPELDEGRYVLTVAQKILSAIAKPFVLIGEEFRVTASIGISTYPQDGTDEQTLTKNADIAMYQAKEEGKNNFQFYSAKLNAVSLERLNLESGLRHALERNEFQLHYQTKLDIRSGLITGMEALLRWQHPDLGTVAPMKFITVAEETGLIVPIGKWVLRAACMQNVAWQNQGLPQMNMSVNLTERQFFDENLLKDLKTILADTGMVAHLLELEITESLLMQDVKKTMQILIKLKEMGIRIAIDDFGIGYISLSTIKQFPLDTIKIDRSFIRDVANDAEDKALAEAIIAMGRKLSLNIVAQGVETKAQADFLRQNACDEFQGFYFHKPVPADQMMGLLRAQSDTMSIDTDPSA